MPTGSPRWTAARAAPRSSQVLAGGRLGDGHEAVGGEQHVDLLVDDAVLAGHGHRHEEHADDVVAVALDARPRLAACDERGGEKRLGRRVHPRREVRAKLVGRRVVQVDPARRLAHMARLAAGSAGVRYASA